jgi:hypothetical protein
MMGHSFRAIGLSLIAFFDSNDLSGINRDLQIIDEDKPINVTDCKAILILG